LSVPALERKKKEKTWRDELSWMRVFFMKFWFESRGVRKFFAKAPAVVTEVSWPSFADYISGEQNEEEGEDELIFGVMNIHCGRVFALRSL
jgi:hypothetical protein